MLDYKTIGGKIRVMRKERKMTQEELAEAVGVGITHISHIETGNSIPSLQVLVGIINTLGCSADELLCIDVKEAHENRQNWLTDLVADCSLDEIKIISDTLLSLKTSLRRVKYF